MSWSCASSHQKAREAASELAGITGGSLNGTPSRRAKRGASCSRYGPFERQVHVRAAAGELHRRTEHDRAPGDLALVRRRDRVDPQAGEIAVGRGKLEVEVEAERPRAGSPWWHLAQSCIRANRDCHATPCRLASLDHRATGRGMAAAEPTGGDAIALEAVSRIYGDGPGAGPGSGRRVSARSGATSSSRCSAPRAAARPRCCG